MYWLVFHLGFDGSEDVEVDHLPEGMIQNSLDFLRVKVYFTALYVSEALNSSMVPNSR